MTHRGFVTSYRLCQERVIFSFWFLSKWCCLGILPRVVRDGCRLSVLILHLFANSVISWLHLLPARQQNWAGAEKLCSPSYKPSPYGWTARPVPSSARCYLMRHSRAGCLVWWLSHCMGCPPNPKAWLESWVFFFWSSHLLLWPWETAKSSPWVPATHVGDPALTVAGIWKS